MMVAAWFAALFGLGSLALRPTLLESFVLALRLDLIVPAAVPPLGFTFRLLLALAMFTLGGVLGFLLARRIARGPMAAGSGPRFTRKETASASAVVPVPVPDIEDEDEDSDFARLDSARHAQAASSLPGRRRALTMEEEFEIDRRALEAMPGGAPEILDLSVLDSLEQRDGAEAECSEAECSEADWGDASQDEPSALPEPAAETREQQQPFDAPAPAALSPLPVFGQISGDAAHRLVGVPVESLGVVQLAERLALAISRKREAADMQDVEAGPVQPSQDQPPASSAIILPPPLPVPPQPEFKAPDTYAAQFDRLVAAPGEVEIFAAPARESAARAPFSGLPPLPAALRPLSLEDREDEAPLEVIVPPRGFTMPASPASPTSDEAEQGEAEQGEAERAAGASCGSLAKLSAPVRIEEPEAAGDEIEPVVVFPGQQVPAPFGAELPQPSSPQSDPTPPDLNQPGMARPFDAPPVADLPVRMPTAATPAVDAEETERQLKAALATLQRMSGAA